MEKSGYNVLFYGRLTIRRNDYLFILEGQISDKADTILAVRIYNRTLDQICQGSISSPGGIGYTWRNIVAPVKGYAMNIVETPSSVTFTLLNKIPLSGEVEADGTEQAFEISGSQVMGYIDLSRMDIGDVVIVRQYVRMVGTSEYRKYAEETYSGVQVLPVIHVVPKRVSDSVKISIQQMVGVLKTFRYEFIDIP